MSMEIPVIDLDVFITGSHNQEAVIQECKKAAEALINYGALVLHDSRVAEKDTFLDLMEDYFNPSRPLHDLKKDQRLVQGLQATGSKSPTSATNEPCRLPKYPTSDTHLHSHQKVHVFNSAKNKKNTLKLKI